MVANSHSQPTAKVDEAPQSHAEKRRPKRAALFFAFLLALVAVFCFLWLNVWPETARREAYLPELEDKARHASYDGRLLALVGARQIESHEYHLAAESLQKALAAAEVTPLIRLNLAAAMEANGERPLALAHLRLALEAHPQDAELQAALSRIQKIPVPAAPGVLAPALCPQGPQPLVEIYAKGSFLNGLAQWWGHRYPEKSGFTTRALWVAAQPEDAEAQRLWGLALMRNRRLMEAEAPLRKAVELAPQSAQAHLALGNLQEQIGHHAAASLEYIATLKVQRDSLPALLGLGRTTQKGIHIGKAIRSFRRATEVAPDSVEAWTGLARSYQLTGLGYDKSAAAYKKAMELAPDNPDFLNDYVISLYRASRQSEAETIVRRRLQTAPSDALSHYLLGMVLMNTNPTPERIAEAEKHTREALKLNKGNPAASIQLAQLFFQQNKEAEESVRLLQNAIRLEPYNRKSRFLLGRLYRRMGKNALADKISAETNVLFQNQQKAADLAEKERKSQLDANGREKLAHLYEITGEVSKAQRQRQILELKKTDPQAPSRIQRDYDEAIDQVLGKPQDSLEKD